MSNRGFKGAQLGVSSVNISGSTADVQVQFVDKASGQVHAIMKHGIPLAGEGSSPEITKTAHDFMSALQNHIARMHFTEPEVGTPREENTRGISESLRGEADEPI